MNKIVFLIFFVSTLSYAEIPEFECFLDLEHCETIKLEEYIQPKHVKERLYSYEQELENEYSLSKAWYEEKHGLGNFYSWIEEQEKDIKYKFKKDAIYIVGIVLYRFPLLLNLGEELAPILESILKTYEMALTKQNLELARKESFRR